MKNAKIFLNIIFFLGIVFGQSINDLNEARKMYEDYKASTSEFDNQLYSTDSTLNGVPIQADTLFQNYLLDTSKENKNYFGYDYFTLRDSIRIWPNVSIPENYVLGPGDNVEISIWGRAQLNRSYYINRDGNIYDESIGLVSLDGKTLKDARALLLNHFSDKISSLKGNNPTSFINVGIGKLKSINVHFVGRVNYPGVHLLHPLSSVINGLLQAGGVDTSGTLRKIKIMRNGIKFKEVDLYGFLVNGDISESIILQNDDVVVVPTRVSSFEIIGEVYHPGIFETLPTENLMDLLEYAGGLRPDASTDLKLKRIIPIKDRLQFSSFYQNKMINYDELEKIITQNGDILAAFLIPKIKDTVTISGQVKEPREFNLTDSLTIKKLLIRAGGIEDNNFINTINLDQIEVLRINPESDENIVLKIDLKELLTTNKYDDFFLKKDDHVVVHRNIYYTHENVIIEGEVERPGVYALNKKDKSLKNIIDIAGGFTSNAFHDGIKVYRNNTKLIWDTFEITLQEADSIFVPVVPHTVFVDGEVYNPGYIHYKNGKSVRNYIESAGGIRPTGNRKDILVTYPNGNVKTNGLFPRKVVDGSTITVNIKPEKEPVEWGQFVRDTISLSTSIILTWVAIERIK